MSISLGQEFPNFQANTTIGRIDFHQFMRDSWCILFSHPRDFTPVCTTELGCAAELVDEFKKRKCKMIALSCDDIQSHKSWIEDIKKYSNIDENAEFPFPIIEDKDFILAAKFHMIDHIASNKIGQYVTARACFIIGPDRLLKLSILYPATTGRNFDEILRVIDSLQLCHKHGNKIATPVNWKQGDDVFIDPCIQEDEARMHFPRGFQTIELPSKKSYLRKTEQP